LADKFREVEFVYPVHLNPNVRDVVFAKLNEIKNIHLMKPLPYPEMIYLMEKANIVLTDSGGIQEEAPALGKPVLVMREKTERQEGTEAGTTKLVGTNREKITREVSKLLTDEKEYTKMANSINPYGDGTTSVQVAKILGE
jgi:UDP-N-acetylglucosamine 2-epimerase (non-hydrolysing)